tara:strand:- start:248 stop:550 length:303 start_codon:yes stop_codon:yes gene_type:complete
MMSHPNGYTKEMIKEILGTSWPIMGDRETGNELRKRIGREIREGKRPKPIYPSAESRAKLPNFDENGKYIYPEGSGFNYVQYLKDHPDCTEAGTYGSKVS